MSLRVFRLPHVYTLSVFDSAPRIVVCLWEEACRSSKQSCSQTSEDSRREGSTSECRWTLDAAALWRDARNRMPLRRVVREERDGDLEWPVCCHGFYIAQFP